MKRIVLLFTTLGLFLFAQSQDDQDPPVAVTPVIKTIPTNRIIGKIMGAEDRKAIGAASLQLSVIKKDSLNNISDSIIRAKLSQANGDFEFNDLPSADSFRLVISSIGYQLEERIFSFDKRGNEPLSMDLGNIMIRQASKQLDNIVITARRPAMEMGVDRRIFNVDASLTATGGTAIDVIKNIPSLTVDAEGNVQMRNSTPQIFIDGRPTILTLDQIPADNIERVELVTNPSAKFDASTTAGILNIILKKNRKIGLNGIASIGGGYPDTWNGSLNLNTRQGKINVFASGNYNQSGSISNGRSLRTNKDDGTVINYFNQYSNNERLRKFASFRAGLDYFIDNRNTISFSHNYVNGRFTNSQVQDQEYLSKTLELERYGDRLSDSRVNFNRNTSQVNYTHRFPEQGKELTANASYNFGKGNNYSVITNSFFNPDGSLYEDPNIVRNESGNSNDQLTLQLDFADPQGENAKLEMGLRSFVNKHQSDFSAWSQKNGTETLLPLSNNIAYTEVVNAFYITYSNKIGKTFSYQAGLRAEQSEFNGSLLDNGTQFGYNYPKDFNGLFDALFPSLFLTKQLGENTELQLNYSRRIRRPNFWQLNPFFDINDPVNVSIGNPLLRPEYTNSFELNADRQFENGNVLAVLYYRNNQGDITRYSDTITQAQYQQLNNAAVDPNAVVNTFINATATNRLGVEFVWQYKIGSNFDITPSLDLQYRKVIAGMDHLNLDNEGFNWEAKLVSNYKIVTDNSPFLNNFAFQVIGEYESPEIVPQGRRVEQFSIDLGVRKEFLKNKKAALTFNVSDIFWTNKWGSVIDTERFYQDSYRRDVRTFRITFSYKFGSADFQFNRNNERERED